METHQPDQTRTLGEEAIGAIERLHASPSKSRRSCANGLFGALPIILVNAFRYEAIPALLKRFGGSQENWFVVAVVAIFGMSYQLRRAVFWIVRTKPEHVTLKRDEEHGTTSHSPAPSSSRPQIWEGFFIRFCASPFCLCASIWFLLILLRVTTPVPQILMAFLSALFFYYAVAQLNTLFHPLIRVDDDGIQIKRRKLLWSNIERIQITNDTEGTATTNWRFFNATDERLAQVSLADSSLDVQKQLVSIIAQALNTRTEEFPPYEPTTPIEDASHSTLKRPY